MTPPVANPEERLSLLAALTEILVAEAKMDERAARALAVKVVGKFRQRLRGCHLYVAQSDPQDTAERDAAIRRDYDGSRSSRERLQLRWDVSKSTFYRIVNCVL